VFISYSHSEPDEVALAAELCGGLTRAGCEVFIDSAILVGTDWVAEIERRIHWCDFLIVLLSERAATSEMVQGEIRLALASRRTRGGQPDILPVRVRYLGALDYELDSHLSRIQYAAWDSAADTPALLEQLTAAAMRRVPLPLEATGTPPAAPPPSRPLPRIDPRALTVEGGSLPFDEPLYVSRAADDVVEDLAGRTGQTVVIKAPKQMGKSSLLIRYLARCRQATPPKTIAYVDLSLLSQDELSTYPVFLSQFAAILLQAFELDPPDALSIPNQLKMTWFVEDQILKRIAGPLVVALDAVDRVLGRSYQADFFTMLRLWHNNRALKPRWREVDWVMVISTEPYLLINDAHRSIFSVGRTITLEPFTVDDYRALDEACGAGLTGEQITALWDLLGGHPYLTRVAFYWLASGSRISYDALSARAIDERGPFGEHLRAMLMRLHTRREMLDNLQTVLHTGRARDEDVAHRLVAAGVIRRAGNTFEPANKLYARFFQDVLR